MKASFNSDAFCGYDKEQRLYRQGEMIDHHHVVVKADQDMARHLEIERGSDTLVCNKIFYADKQLCAVAGTLSLFPYLKDVDMWGGPLC